MIVIALVLAAYLLDGLFSRIPYPRFIGVAIDRRLRQEAPWRALGILVAAEFVKVAIFAAVAVSAVVVWRAVA